ncbi:MAG: hypothetical protein IJD86_00640 [Clostridia bacterium]|nr:hypothetical protein [Clostridia bacterium]
MDITSYLTPFKYGKSILSPSGKEGAFDRYGVDCPFVFRHLGKTYLMHVGFDGTGYQTALTVCEDDTLLHWRSLGVILPRGERGHWDASGRAGIWLLSQDDIHKERTLKKVNGRYWMFFHSYPGEGYETGAAEMGLAWCEDEDLLTWHPLDHPVYSWKDGAAWEKGGLYKCCAVEKDGRYYMFYNAKNVTEGFWHEQTGFAVSDDLLHWQRGADEPVIKVTEGAWDCHFASDPFVVYDSKKDIWVMFYFGLGKRHAQEGIALSRDLIHWEKYPEPIITAGEEGAIDSTHAHKPAVIQLNGILYHFYCAVRGVKDEEEQAKFGNEFRSITVARSIPF